MCNFAVEVEHISIIFYFIKKWHFVDFLMQLVKARNRTMIFFINFRNVFLDPTLALSDIFSFTPTLDRCPIISNHTHPA